MSRRLFVLIIAMATFYVSSATGVQAKGPPESAPGLGMCSAPTLARPAEECEVGVRARQLTAEEAGVGVGQTRTESVEAGEFWYCYPPTCGPDMCSWFCVPFRYRAIVLLEKVDLVYAWLLNPAPGGAVLDPAALEPSSP